MTEKTGSGNVPDTPQTGAAGNTDTSPATDAGALGKMGAPPQAASTGDQRGPGLESTTRTPDISGAHDDSYWRRTFTDRGYVDADRGYEYYRPAFQFGWERRRSAGEQDFDTIEEDLRAEWDNSKGQEGPPWDEARPAIRDAWHHAGGETGSTGPGNPMS